MKSVLSRFPVPALVALALGLRLWGIAFGLPYPYHPDEPAHVRQALTVGHDLSRGLTFANPPLYKYLLFMGYIISPFIGWRSGILAVPHDFDSQFRADPTAFYLTGRAISAFLGAAIVIAAYALASALRGRRAGFLAAWLAAVAYLLVRESHFAVNDALVALSVALALYFCVRMVHSAVTRDYVAAGALVGLAFAAKYQGVVVVFPLILAHFLHCHTRRLGALLLGLGAAAAAVLICFPPLVLETGRVLQDMYVHLYLPGQIGYDGLDPAGGYVYYLKVLLWGLGGPIVVAAGAGMLFAAVRRDRPLLVVACLPIALYAIMGYERMFFARFILPAVPALVVLAAVAGDALIEQFSRYLKGPLATGFTNLALAAMLGVPSLLNSMRFDLILTREDTRTEAHAWIESHLPAGSRLAVDWFPFGPPLSSERYDLLIANGWSLFDQTIDDYRQRGIVYLVVSSYAVDLPLLDPNGDARRQAFYPILARDAEVVAEFRPYMGDRGPAFVYDQIYAPFDHLETLERPGPTITVYNLSAGTIRP